MIGLLNLFMFSYLNRECWKCHRSFSGLFRWKESCGIYEYDLGPYCFPCRTDGKGVVLSDFSFDPMEEFGHVKI